MSIPHKSTLDILICTIFYLVPALTLEATITTIDAINSASDLTTTIAPLLPTTAAKWVRYRRMPPSTTIIKHVIRSSKRSKARRRVKRPKLKYGPPNYSYGEPITYYKPTTYSVSPDIHTIDEFQHLNLDAADFDLPPSSYETQSMDVDFYNHDSDIVYSNPKLKGIEYSYDVKSEPPSPPSTSYSYRPVKSKKSSTRTPHQIYGVPKHYGHDGVDDLPTISDGGGYHEISDEPPYDHPPSHATHENTYLPTHSENYDSEPSSPPSYGGNHVETHSSYSEGNPPTDTHQPPSSSQYLPYSPSPPIQDDYHPPSHKQGSYHMYDKKIPNTVYSHIPDQHHYSEPPQQPSPPPPPPPHHYIPSHHGTEIEITPSYEINLTSYNQEGGNLYQNSQPTGNFAEPPIEMTSSHEPPSHHDITSDISPPPPPPQQPEAPQQPEYHPGLLEDFLPPSEELPLNPNHKEPAYDYPKSSYEVPIYDPIPFEASNQNEQDFYPPHPYDLGPDQTIREEHHSIVHHTNHAEGESKFIPYQFDQNQHTYDTTDVGDDGATAATSSTKSPHMRRRKRKRNRGSSTSAKRHILDVPELKQAFEEAKYSDADVHASNHFEQRHKYAAGSGDIESTATSIYGDDKYISHAWNPIRIRSTSYIPSPAITTTTTTKAKTKSITRPSTTDSITSSHTNRSRKISQYRPYSRKPSAQTSGEILTMATKATTPSDTNAQKVSILSIDKSRSHSYYDGTVATPSQTHSNVNRSRFNKFRTPTRSTKQATGKRTTKSIYDTTLFKSPQNDNNEEYRPSTVSEGDLPKNHKFF